MFPQNHRLLQISITPVPVAGDANVGLEIARQRSQKKLSWLPQLEDNEIDQMVPKRVSNVISWLKHQRLQRRGNEIQSQLVLSGVENLLFGIVTSIDEAVKGWDTNDVKNLVELVDLYQGVLHSFLGTTASKSHIRVELRSRETLVVW
ncbi:unnamed protein product, partial [Choristocarpus tenellus]